VVFQSRSTSRTNDFSRTHLTELPVDTAYLHGVEIKAVRPKSTNNSDDWKPGETRHSPLPVNPFRPFDNYTDYTWARWMKKLGASRNNTNKFLKDVRDPRFNLEELSFPNAKRMEEKIAKGIEDEGVRVRPFTHRSRGIF